MKQRLSELHANRCLSADSGAGPVRIALDDGLIGAVETTAPPAGIGDLLAMPALANAHDHGRGLRPLCYGAFDQALETWFTALNVHPVVDPYLNAACAFARMAQSGIGLAVHCHMATNSPKLIDDAVAVCRAAEDIGIRLAFVVPMRDRYRLGYVPDEVVLQRLPANHRDSVRQRWLREVLPAKEQIDIADEIGRRCTSRLVDVLYGPAAPHWCTNHMMELVAEASARTGRRVHMHCLETRYQREFADAAFPEGLIPYLRRIRLLTDRLTLAHGVYLRRDEMETIAEAGVIVSLNTCSNLRLRSGIAPAAQMEACGVPLAVGIDALGLDDEEDGFRELRLTYLLHAGVSFDEGLSKAALLQAALVNGPRAVTGRASHGKLAPGMPADILVLDYAKLSDDVMPHVTPELEVVLARTTGQHVRALVVDGVEIVRDRKVLGIDQALVEKQLFAQAKAMTQDYVAAKPLLEVLQATLRQCYVDGLHREHR